MRQIERAIIIATEAHQNQVDKSGVPYIFHPLRVMEAARASGFSEEMQIAAVLHDVVEDTSITLNDLERSFSNHIVNLVDLLSRRSDETYRQYIHRLAVNPEAKAIKLLDIADNQSPARMANLPESVQRGLKERALLALSIFNENI